MFGIQPNKELAITYYIEFAKESSSPETQFSYFKHTIVDLKSSKAVYELINHPTYKAYGLKHIYNEKNQKQLRIDTYFETEKHYQRNEAFQALIYDLLVAEDEKDINLIVDLAIQTNNGKWYYEAGQKYRNIGENSDAIEMYSSVCLI